MKKLRQFFNKTIEIATLKRALIATAIFGILYYMVEFSPIGVAGMLKITNGYNILDLERGYSLSKAYTMLELLGAEGRKFYLCPMMIEDIFFPMSNMLLFGGWISLLLKHLTKDNSNLRYVLIFPILYLVCDWGENIGIAIMLFNYPTRLPIVCSISSTFTIIKFSAVFINFLVILLLSISLIIKQALDISGTSKSI